MEPEEFKRELLKNSDKDYGLCPPPTSGQDGLNILIKHFLGDNWYSTLSISTEQVNSEAIYDILRQNKRKKVIR